MADNPTFTLNCECNSNTCHCTLHLPVDVARAIVSANQVLIANDCRRGPEPTDELVERREGYALYRERAA